MEHYTFKRFVNTKFDTKGRHHNNYDVMNLINEGV